MTKKDLKVKRAIEDIKENHNWCWANEIDYRNKNELNFPILFYRGKKITYAEFMEISNKMACSLKKMGYGPGKEVLACMSNSVEFVMLLRATSLVGAEFHVFGESFAPDYIEQIISKSIAKSNINAIFITDNMYSKLQGIVNKFPNIKKITFSLADSLPNGLDPYIEFDRYFYDFKNLVPDLKENDNNIINREEFLAYGLDQPKVVNNETRLDDDFLISYTSGSTKGNKPSAIVHTNGSLIYMGRFHDADISGLPQTKHIRVLAHIPTHSNTDVITSISDSIMQSCTVALEPIYNEYFFLFSLIINEVSFAPATRGFWLRACKQYENNPIFKNFKLKKLYIPTLVGEPKSPGEEKYINSVLKKMSAGTGVIPKPITPATLSFGGGDTEHGGLFFTLYVSLMEKLNKIRFHRGELGLIPFNSSMEIVCLDEQGNHLGPNQLGILAANSLTVMKEYKDNPEKTKQFFVQDSKGKTYATMNVYGYIDKYKTVHMKGRKDSIALSDGREIPYFYIIDIVTKDSKNILSVELVNIGSEFVIHIEPYPNRIISENEIIESTVLRLANAGIPLEILDKIYFRIRSNEESFPLSGCGKRNNLELIEEGLTSDIIKACVNNEQVEILKPFKEKSKKLVKE